MYIDILLSKKSKYFFLFQYPKLEIDTVWKKWDGIDRCGMKRAQLQVTLDSWCCDR